MTIGYICKKLLHATTAKKPVVVFDLDNTLADMTHRLDLAAKRDFVKFYDACVSDTPMTNIIDLAKSIYEGGVSVEIWTCRSSAVRAQTEAQLAEWGVPYDCLKMRPANDWRKGEVVKTEWYNAFVQTEPDRYVAVAFDDNDHILAMWRDVNVRAFKVIRPGEGGNLEILDRKTLVLVKAYLNRLYSIKARL